MSTITRLKDDPPIYTSYESENSLSYRDQLSDSQRSLSDLEQTEDSFEFIEKANQLLCISFTSPDEQREVLKKASFIVAKREDFKKQRPLQEIEFTLSHRGEVRFTSIEKQDGKYWITASPVHGTNVTTAAQICKSLPNFSPDILQKELFDKTVEQFTYKTRKHWARLQELHAQLLGQERIYKKDRDAALKGHSFLKSKANALVLAEMAAEKKLSEFLALSLLSKSLPNLHSKNVPKDRKQVHKDSLMPLTFAVYYANKVDELYKLLPLIEVKLHHKEFKQLKAYCEKRIELLNKSITKERTQIKKISSV